MKTLKELSIEHKCDKAAEGHHTYDKPYEFHFSPFRDKEIKLLEIGAGGYDNPNEGGASLRMWKEYFHNPETHIYSIDIFDKMAIQEERIIIFKCSQTDEVGLENIVSVQIGEPDIIVDDGSHVNSDVITSFKILFPKLKTGGIYVCEDLQTAYWNHYGGDPLEDEHTSMGYFIDLIHGLNYKEVNTEMRGRGSLPYDATYFDLNITSVHFYHNIIFIYKGDNSITA